MIPGSKARPRQKIIYDKPVSLPHPPANQPEKSPALSAALKAVRDMKNGDGE